MRLTRFYSFHYKKRFLFTSDSHVGLLFSFPKSSTNAIGFYPRGTDGLLTMEEPTSGMWLLPLSEFAFE